MEKSTAEQELLEQCAMVAEGRLDDEELLSAIETIYDLAEEVKRAIEDRNPQWFAGFERLDENGEAVWHP